MVCGNTSDQCLALAAFVSPGNVDEAWRCAYEHESGHAHSAGLRHVDLDAAGLGRDVDVPLLALGLHVELEGGLGAHGAGGGRGRVLGDAEVFLDGELVAGGDGQGVLALVGAGDMEHGAGGRGWGERGGKGGGGQGGRGGGGGGGRGGRARGWSRRAGVSFPPGGPPASALSGLPSTSDGLPPTALRPLPPSR